MEIPIIESGITRFQSPNLFLHLKTLWTWGALILAAIATFSSLIRRSKRLILKFRKGKSVIPHPSSYTYSSDDDDDDDVSCSSSDDEDEDEEEEEEVSSASEKDFSDFEEIPGQNCKSDHHFAWPQLTRAGSVVKFWDGLGLGYDHSNRSVSLLDLNRDEILRSVLWESDETPAVRVASPETFLTAGEGGLKVWDARSAGDAPAATWQSERLGRLVGIGGGNNKVFIGYDVGKLTVVDLRNVRSQLAETSWWGDRAVTAGDGAGLVSWCRNAARCFTLL